MRSAQIIGKIDPREIEKRLPPDWVDLVAASETDGQGFVERLTSIEDWNPHPLQAINSALYMTRSIGPHTDDVLGDYTLGLVLRGDHTLFTGNGRHVGRLERGSVYLLENKRLHGAHGESLLVFVACDFAAHSRADALDKALSWLDAGVQP